MRTHGSLDSTGENGLPDASAAPDLLDDLQSALDRCPAAPGTPPSSNPWHDLLYRRLRNEALPALVTTDTITPASSLWTGSRLWIRAFRSTDLRPGDRLVLALPPSTAFVQVLVAALWEGFTVALARPTDDLSSLVDTLDVRAAVAPEPAPHTWMSGECDGPQSTPEAVRSPNTAPTPDVRFLVRTSGTTTHARWVALSDRNVLSVLASHLPHFSLRDARVLSVLPWTHTFGLVLDLFPALLSGAELIRDPEGGRSPQSLIRLHDAWDATHLSTVPLTIQQLLDHPEGEAVLQRLDGGVVGGAPISGPLADRLSQTSLRVGYGLTEAAPGVALGPRGEWAPHYLGRPVGCSVEIAEDGELLFEGPNARVGIWRDGGLDRADSDRPVHTGDLVERRGDDLFFRGRTDDAFKLSNGRLVQAGALEAELKTRFPEFHDALVFTPNGSDVAVAVCPNDPEAAPPSTEAVREVLGSLENRLAWTTSVEPEAWSTLSKGSVDRHTMTDTLTMQYRSATPHP